VNLSPIDRLQATNPRAEIWWDSSPLVFPHWRDEMIAAAPPGGRDELRVQLERLVGAETGPWARFRGCTTNPPLSLAAVKRDPAAWNDRIDALAADHPDLDARGLAWVVYKEIIGRGAAAFRGLWEESQGRYGYVSGQLDPRLLTDIDTMIGQAREIASVAPNVMVKVPATTQGIEVLRAVTAAGICTNVTTCFTTSQVMAAARATTEGLAMAKANGVDLKHWRAVITLMIARLTEREVIKEQAEARGIRLSAADLKWFGIAVFKNSYRLLQDGGFPSKLLLCSVRPGPVVAGRTAFWDIEEVAGSDIVYTLPPVALTPLFDLAAGLAFDAAAIERDVPADSLARITQTPYGLQSYDPNGMSQDQFSLHPATIFTVAEFSRSATGLEEYVAGRIGTSPDRDVRHKVGTATGGTR
jgi:transaldolase